MRAQRISRKSQRTTCPNFPSTYPHDGDSHTPNHTHLPTLHHAATRPISTSPGNPYTRASRHPTVSASASTSRAPARRPPFPAATARPMVRDATRRETRRRTREDASNANDRAFDRRAVRRRARAVDLRGGGMGRDARGLGSRAMGARWARDGREARSVVEDARARMCVMESRRARIASRARRTGDGRGRGRWARASFVWDRCRGRVPLGLCARRRAETRGGWDARRE